jgi:protein-tyrosine phosphatase
MFRVLFVCTGNTCRSPMAAELLRHELAQAGIAAEVGSAGLRTELSGAPADPRARQVLRSHGLGSDHAVRQFDSAMFASHDLLIALDSNHAWVLAQLAPTPAAAARIRLLGSFGPTGAAGWDVPDPVGGDIGDYERALRLIRSAMPGVLAEITAATSTCPAAGGGDCG